MKLVKGITTAAAWIGQGHTVFGLVENDHFSGYTLKPGEMPQANSLPAKHIKIEFETDLFEGMDRLRKYDDLQEKISALNLRCEELSDDREDLEKELAAKRAVTFMDFFGAAPAKLTVEFQVNPTIETIHADIRVPDETL